MVSKSYKQYQREGQKPLCHFCKKPVGRHNKNKHHIFGRKNSNETEWCHQGCHNKHNQQEQVNANEKEKKWWKEHDARED